METKLPERKPNRLPTFDYSQGGAYFVTVCTKDRRKWLSRIDVGTPLLGCPQMPRTELLPHGVIAAKYILQMDAFYDELTVDKYVIMPDHIHILISVHGADGHPGRGVPTTNQERTSVIARFVGTFKRFSNREYGENIWQGRYYDHVIRSQQDYNDVWQYMENNPYRWMEKYLQ